MIRTQVLSVLAMSLFSAGILVSASAGEGEGKPTVAELKARLATLRANWKFTSEQGLADAIVELKKLGPAQKVQGIMADLYLDATKEDERIFLLVVLNRVGVEHASKALPAIAADYAVARPKHPNDMSFAGFYVLEKFMGLAWQKLPAEKKNKGPDETKDVKGNPPPPPPAPDENKPNKVAADGFCHTGSPADRKAITQFLLDHKLQVVGKKTYPIPVADNIDWVRVVGKHAFVRLRGESSGVDYIFVKSKDGEWCYLASLGHWVN